MAKPDRISDLERRQSDLEEQINKALSCYPDDDPMIGDLKRRILHLKHELRHQRYLPGGSRYLH